MSYLEYVKEQVSHSSDWETKDYNPLEDYKNILDDLTKRSPSFKSAVDGIKKERIGRQDIFKYYEEGDLLTGFWITLLWGNISHINLRRVIADDVESSKDSNDKQKKSLLDRLDDVLSKIKGGQLKDAFESLYTGDNKIHGVGISFLTKILYFMKGAYTGNPKPLIYDRWTRGIDAALIADGVKPDVDNYKVSFGPKGGYRDPVIPQGINPSQMYLNYLQRMAGFGVESDKLEEHLFGFRLNGPEDNEDNPRRKLIDCLKPLTTNTNNTPKRNTKQQSSKGNGIVLRVYNGPRESNVGKTLEIVNGSNWKTPVKSVFVEYGGKRFQANEGTYNSGAHNTLSNKPRIQNLIKDNGWKPGDEFPYEFEVLPDGSHLYKIKS